MTMVRFLASAGLALFVFLPQAASAQPAGIRGKSIELRATESFNARRPSGHRSRHLVRPWTLQIYFGSKGTTFARVKGHTGKSETVGTSTKSHAGGQRVLQWKGRRLIVTGSASTGGVRRLIVDFGPDFTSCSARLIFAVRPGATWVSIRKEVEIWAPSWKGSVTACKMFSRNILR